MSFYVKTSRPEDWQSQLAKPNKQWKTGHSAKALAYCWMDAEGFPSSVRRVFQRSEYGVFKNIEFLVGFVEYEVSLPPRGHPSQNDILVLAKNNKDLVAIAVEGKVSEPFDETVGDWLRDESKGKKTRLEELSKLLQLNQSSLKEIRYQLLHRTASAVIEAKRFNAVTALMIVHSFSQNDAGLIDYKNFASLFGISADKDVIYLANKIEDIKLYLAWITGEKEYLAK